MKIRDVLTDKGRQVVTVWPEKQLGDIPRLFDERNIASVLAVDHAENPLGIVTDRDVLRALARVGITAFERQVSEAMESPPPSWLPNDTVNQILRVMTERRVRHVVVMHDRKMVGIVRIGDLVKFQAQGCRAQEPGIARPGSDTNGR